MRLIKCLLGPLAVSLALTGCGGPAASTGQPNQEHAHDHAHDHAENHGAGHTHTAPRGGTLIPIGDHEANIEVVIPESADHITLYFLDAHAEHPIRLSAPELPVQLEIPGQAPVDMVLKPEQSALTGEQIGDSSAFSAPLAGLQDLAEFRLTIPRLDLRGAVYEGLSAQVQVKN